ncbi:hypothetical protein, partial [Actinomadura verrucosospora]|uniref:hypothetical protein n=1 Tax=Actinomadura verrucosospora TaxID=46165 RepID=UPI0031ECC3A2
RHPPYALKNLNTQNDQNKSQINNKNNPKTHPPERRGLQSGSHHSPEMLASTVQFSKNNRAHQNHTTMR